MTGGGGGGGGGAYDLGRQKPDEHESVHVCRCLVNDELLL